MPVKSRSSLNRPAFFLFLCLLPGLACGLPPVYSAQDYLPPTVTGYPAHLQTLAAATLAPVYPATASPTLPAATAASTLLPPAPTLALPTPQVTSVKITLPTEIPAVYVPPTAVVPVAADGTEFLVYSAQPGDALPALAARFNVPLESIVSNEPLDPGRLVMAGQTLFIPNALADVPRWGAVLPDSEVIYGSGAGMFDVEGYILQAGGFLNEYGEMINNQWHTGPEIIRRVATQTSVNPQLLLAFIEYRAHWVTGQPVHVDQLKYPLGFYAPDYEGLYNELSIAANHINIGYYGWRTGTRTTLEFKDRSQMRVNPEQNAGSAAVQHLFSKFFPPNGWTDALYGGASFPNLYARMFGDPWERALSEGPLFPPGLEQPVLELPFQPGQRWALTAGPHITWTSGTPRGALDFAPITGESPCVMSRAWAVASAPGLVVRSENNAVALDLDGDGNEGTGWVLLYYHIAAQDMVPDGTWLPQDGLIGHPSCEGGRATGTHLHIARKYNGEWLTADGPLPMIMSGWTAHAGERPYDGSLTRGDLAAISNVNGSRTSVISR